MIDIARFVRNGRHLLTVGAVVVASLIGTASLAVAAPIMIVDAHVAATTSTTSDPNSGGVSISVVHSGLFVDTATVSNLGVPAGTAKVINKGDGSTHTGPRIGNNESWTYTFNRDVKNGDVICGQVGNSVEPCVTITN